MTDKQLIIDGVDVSECNFCEWKSSDIPQCRIRLASFESTCKGYNCHYKQLKAKEQECEELKEKIENYCFDCDVAERMRKVTYAVTGGRLSYANYTVEAIEQAYDDQLRIDVEYRTKELEEQLDQLKAENEKLKNEIEACYNQVEDFDIIATSKSNKLKQAEQKLERIKEIAENRSNYPCGKCIKGKILQIIDEVE